MLLKEMNIDYKMLLNYAVQNVKQWTNMPPISEELYAELVKEFNNERFILFFNESYIL